VAVKIGATKIRRRCGNFATILSVDFFYSAGVEFIEENGSGAGVSLKKAKLK
jgi:hypothetical protein